MKKCCRCDKEKPIEEFHKRSVNSDGRQGYCKECAKIHYKKWADQSPERKHRHDVWRKARMAENRAMYREYMADKNCIDCGNSDFRVLVHDHVNGEKRGGVQELLSRGHRWEVILEEIAKCEIRCANCHTIVTAERGNWWNSV